MPYKLNNLPDYPAKEDVWDVLKKEKRPIVIYGMGNGADKLFLQFEKYGIEAADLFASDGFVRGHSYRGYKVKSFSEIKESYKDFVIVLSFASNRPDVIEMLKDINAKHTMYVPDMPIADVTEYFDKDFYNANYGKIKEIYESLADEESRAIYSSVINYRLSGKMDYLTESFTEKEELYGLLNSQCIEVMIDAGAYNGDTAREAEACFKNLKKIYAIEPDRRSYKKLVKYAENSKTDIVPFNAAVWSYSGVGSFMDSGNRNSTVGATASYRHRETEIPFIAIDSLTDSKVDFIKYDVEGSEYEALIGTEKTLMRDKPVLLVSVYHKSKDIFAITDMLMRKYPDYDFYMRRLCCIPAWEIDLVMIHKEKE